MTAKRSERVTQNRVVALFTDSARPDWRDARIELNEVPMSNEGWSA